MTRFSALRATSFFFATCALACGVDEHAARVCEVDADCPSGGSCYRGFCIDEICEVGEERVCFDGDPALVDPVAVGNCRQGRSTCGEDERFGACVGQVLPGAELCNEEDDDCDGRVDELAGTTCETGLPGVCAAGTLACGDAGATCESITAESDEICNGEDDDCDGETDEGLDGVPCFEGVGCTATEVGFDCVGTCRAGLTACDGTTLSCVGAVTPVPSEDECTTEGDADCDGAIDEGCPCTNGATRDCYGGPAGTEGMGVCVGGTQTCTDGSWGECVGERTPSEETCANEGADDDCDGTMDDIPLVGTSCNADAMGVCRQGTWICLDDVRSCQPGPAAESERCDGVDEDCDGTVDEAQTDCGSTCCGGGSCVELQNDPMNCGGCLVRCAPTQICSNGDCCAAGLTSCGGACVDTQTNRDHCGQCGRECSDGVIGTGLGRQTCLMGVCR